MKKKFSDKSEFSQKANFVNQKLLTQNLTSKENSLAFLNFMPWKYKLSIRTEQKDFEEMISEKK